MKKRVLMRRIAGLSLASLLAFASFGALHAVAAETGKDRYIATIVRYFDPKSGGQSWRLVAELHMTRPNAAAHLAK